MRHADILQLHYQYAFTRLNPGKPVILPPNGFSGRALPAPGPAPTAETATPIFSATRANERTGADRSAPSKPDNSQFTRDSWRSAAPFVVEVSGTLRPAPTKRGPRVVERVQAESIDVPVAPRDGYQQVYIHEEYPFPEPVQDAIRVKIHDASPAASTSNHLSTRAKALLNAAWSSRLPPNRKGMTIAAALAVGVLGTSLYFAHPNVHAIALAWSTYRTAANSDHTTAHTKVSDAKPTATAPSAPATKGTTVEEHGEMANPTGASVPEANPHLDIKVPLAPTQPPRALTSKDLMPDEQKNSPLSSVSPESLRTSAAEGTSQGVASATVPASPTSVYDAPIRRVLPVIHHLAQPVPQAARIRANDVSSGDEAAKSKNKQPIAANLSIPAPTLAPVQAPQQVQSKDVNGDQKLF